MDQLIDVNMIDDGASLYLVPVAFHYGGGVGLPLGGSALKFISFRVIARVGDVRLFDAFIAHDQLSDLLDQMPADVAAKGRRQLSNIQASRNPMALAGTDKNLPFTKPRIMGVLNVTPDSFSDGGDFLDAEKAIAHARAMVAAGADIIDVGGESTRPGAKPVWEGEEAERVEPVIMALAGDGIPISIDTRHSTVMQRALAAGAHIINDVSALTYDADSMEVVKNSDASVILMHAQGTPDTMQDNPVYSDVLLDVFDYLEERIQACEDAGIDRARIITDPGIGFGKRVIGDNMALLNGLALFHGLGCPVLLGASRKRFIGAITGEEDAKARMPGSLTAALKGVEAGVQILRVHDVAETKQAVQIAQAMHDGAIMDHQGVDAVQIND